MGLIKSTINDLLDQIRAENPRFLFTNEQIVVNGHYPNDGTHGSVRGERVVNLGVIESTGKINTVNFGYDRLALSELKRLLNFSVRVPEGVATTHEALPYIEGYYRLGITAGDVEDVALYLDEYSKRHIILRATPDSFGWSGEVDLTILATPESIASLIVNADVGAYGAQETAKAYSYPYDFTDQFETLSTVSTIHPYPSRVIAALTAVTGDTWVNDAANAAPFNYSGATIEFAGINMASKGGNPNYKYLIIVNLTPLCNNMAGQLFIHYNDPEVAQDPNMV